MDLEAANRSTSTYLVNKRLDMLPSLLTTDLCSLKGNLDRYAFSVLWEVTPDAEVVTVEFKKSIIHSIAALTYQQAQSFIDQPKIKYLVRQDGYEYCARITGIPVTPTSRAMACAFWNVRRKECTIVTPITTGYNYLGHELRHCFEGAFHD